MRAVLGEMAARMPEHQVDFATLRALVGFDAYDRLLDTYATPTVDLNPAAFATAHGGCGPQSSTPTWNEEHPVLGWKGFQLA